MLNTIIKRNQPENKKMRNKVVSIKIPNIGTINVSSRMKGQCNGTQMYNAKHYKYAIRIWSKYGEMNVTYHDSTDNWSKGIKKLDGWDLLNALDCILFDIVLFLNDEIEDRFDPYDEYALTKRAEKGCKLETEKFALVVGGKENLLGAIDFLTDFVNQYLE